jgi:SAM-dependent methyltransferase
VSPGSELSDGELSSDDRARLERLRRGFLADPPRSEWRDRRDLELYDATFGQRIAWKWRVVLDELSAQRFAAPAGEVLDLGCGTAIASRAWLGRFGSAATSVRLVDASPRALELARERLQAERANLCVEIGVGGAPPAVLLASHVLGELSRSQRDGAVALARQAEVVVWLEPGERATSRELGRVRDELLDSFDVLAPCTHASACPLLQRGRDADWCHFFARPPQEVFTESRWARFGKELGIDLRSLPYSYLVLRRTESGASASSSGLERVLGRPRTEKGRSVLDVCGAAGCRRLALLDRDAGDELARLRDPAGERLVYRMEWDEKRVRRIERA